MSNLPKELQIKLDNNYEFKGNIIINSKVIVEAWENKSTSQKIAIKIYKSECSSIVRREEQVIAYINENLKDCNDAKKFILKYDSHKYGRNNTYFMSEKYDNDLLKILQQNHDSKNVKPIILNIICQLIHGLYCLHEINVIHADFKIENILINKNQIKIADFGGCGFGDVKPIVSTRLIHDPYIRTKYKDYTESGIIGELNKASDIYALGIMILDILYYLATNEAGYDERVKTLSQETNDTHWHTQINLIKKQLNIKFNEDLLPQPIIDIFLNMLQYDATKRYTIKQLYENELIKTNCVGKLSFTDISNIKGISSQETKEDEDSYKKNMLNIKSNIYY